MKRRDNIVSKSLAECDAKKEVRKITSKKKDRTPHM